MNRRMIVVAILAIVAVGGGAIYLRAVDGRTAEVSRHIRSALARRDMPDDAPWRDRRTQALLRSFYKSRRMRPAWTTGAAPNQQARELTEALLQANREGLSPREYSALDISRHIMRYEGSPMSAGDPVALADFDLLCTIAAFHYMSDVSDGRISPKALDAVWVSKPRKGDLDAMLQRALRRNSVGMLLRELVPTQDGYRKLRDVRARYATVVAAGGWKTIAPGTPLKRGGRGPRVAALRARLVATGDLWPKDSDVFDDDVARAVARVQSRHGLEANGIVGPAELAELNVSAESRLRQVELNMERWRWLPAKLGERYLIVNIPEYMLRVFEGNKQVLETRVVVGKTLSATPVFSDVMTQVVVNPTWNVPASIAKEEIVPAVRENREYLTAHALRVFDGTEEDAKELDPQSIYWWEDFETERLTFRQDAGDSNALGRLKFLFPNQFDVYLHDTPAGHLFSLGDRSFSHGCVRVEDPIRLASYVLRGRSESNPDRIQELIQAGETKWIRVPKPLPVHIVYFTAYVGEDGTVGFREDVYGIDQELIEQLRGRAMARRGSSAG